MIDIERTKKFVDQCWGDEIVPTLVEYIRIPNKSPSFDPDWAAHGHMEEAVALFERWARARLSCPSLRRSIAKAPGSPRAAIFTESSKPLKPAPAADASAWPRV